MSLKREHMDFQMDVLKITNANVDFKNRVVGCFGDQKSRMMDKCMGYITMTLNATFSIRIS